MARHLEKTGMPVEDAAMMASMDTTIKDGAEERQNHVVEEVTGTPPRKFGDFAAREKQSWVKTTIQSSL